MKILLVDDHAIVRDGLRRLLSSLGQHDIREVSTGEDALAMTTSFRPDLIMLDLNLPGLGGLELLRRIVRMGPFRVLVLTMHAEPLYARRSMQAGARGYVSKNALPDELIRAVQKVAAGELFVEGDIAQQLATDQGGTPGPLDQLSPRELEILRLLATGMSLSQIGTVLEISYKTVANTCSIMKSKLGLSRSADLVRLAVQTELG